MSDTVRDRELAPPWYVFGLDLGQSVDWSALCVAQVIERPAARPLQRVGHLARWRGERYTEIVRLVAQRIQELRGPEPLPRDRWEPGIPDRRPRVSLVIDQTGCGRPVCDLFEEAELDCELVFVTITAGEQVAEGERRNEFRVPKKTLVSTLRKLMETDRMQVLEDLPLAKTLTEEAKNFRYRVNLLGNVSFGAAEDKWREEGKHDDLVLSASLSAWYGEHGSGIYDWTTVSGEPVADWFRRAGVNVM